MKTGELFVKELLSRDQPKEILSYEKLQEIKNIDNILELKDALKNSKFHDFDTSKNISDIVDQTLIPYNRSTFLNKTHAWLITIIAILIAIITYLLTDHIVLSSIPLPLIWYYTYTKSLKSGMKNKKYLKQITNRGI